MGAHRVRWAPRSRARTMKIYGALAAVLAIVAVVTSVAAQTSGTQREPLVVLRWEAPPECPTEDQVLNDARTLATHQDATAATRPIPVVEAVVERPDAARWTLTLAVGPAQQRLEAASCAQLARATALFIALMVDASGGEAPHAPAGPLSIDAVPAAASPAPESVPAKQAAARDVGGRREVLVLAAVGPTIDAGTLPRPELLGVLQVGMRYRRVEITLEGAAGTAQDTTISGVAGYRLNPLTVSLAPCYAPLVTLRLRLGPCAQVEVGVIQAEGVGVSQPRSADAALLSFGGELVAWLVLGAHFEVRLGVGVLLPAVRPNFELTGPGSVFEPGVAVRAGTAAVVRF
jgi:hypothetical protein